jgi:hypothetical protein
MFDQRRGWSSSPLSYAAGFPTFAAFAKWAPPTSTPALNYSPIAKILSREIVSANRAAVATPGLTPEQE